MNHTPQAEIDRRASRLLAELAVGSLAVDEPPQVKPFDLSRYIAGEIARHKTLIIDAPLYCVEERIRLNGKLEALLSIQAVMLANAFGGSHGR